MNSELQSVSKRIMFLFFNNRQQYPDPANPNHDAKKAVKAVFCPFPMDEWVNEPLRS